MAVVTLDADPVLDLEAVGEVDAIRRTAVLLAGNKQVVNFEGFVEAVLARQRINPPILGDGVALPHARSPLVREIVCVAARTREPVPFGPEQVPIRLIFLLGIPPARISEYLAATAALVRRLRTPGVIEGLLASDSPAEFSQWLA